MDPVTTALVATSVGEDGTYFVVTTITPAPGA